MWINIKVLYLWSHCSWSWLVEGVGFVCGKTPSSALLRLCEWAKTHRVAMQPASSSVRWGIRPTLWFSNLVFSTGTLYAKSDLSPDKAQRFPLPCMAWNPPATSIKNKVPSSDKIPAFHKCIWGELENMLNSEILFLRSRTSCCSVNRFVGRFILWKIDRTRGPKSVARRPGGVRRSEGLSWDPRTAFLTGPRGCCFCCSRTCLDGTS